MVRWSRALLAGFLVACSSGEPGSLDEVTPDDTASPSTMTPQQPGTQDEPRPQGTATATLWPTTAAATYGSFCAIAGGTLECHGDIADPPEGGGWVTVRAGLDGMWALHEDGTVTFWGDAGRVNSYIADLPEVVRDAEALAVGNGHACWITAGEIRCHGTDLHGQVSDAPAGGGWVQIEADYSWTCALDDTGYLACWGIEDGEGVDYVDHGAVTRAPVDESFDRIRQGGGDQVCGQRPDGSLLCWGDDSFGQASWADGQVVAGWADGQDHLCTLDAEGRASCGGSSESGRTDPPEDVFGALVGGPDYTCGRASADGSWICWGDAPL